MPLAGAIVYEKISAAAAVRIIKKRRMKGGKPRQPDRKPDIRFI